ncbi:MAG: aspartate/glutamate racemase family protein [Rhodothermales bacterium]|nr:aspartate/glutamate racemase family protein [Rhodothermales bacterium]MBO6780924.1 aspartate/glutamate racemase family protein [Rhodothermales bacterium]
MGPHAGIHLATCIVDQTIAQGDFDHLSVVLVSRPGEIPDRSAFLANASEASPSGPILSVAQQLRDVGASLVGMPCNTAHAPPILSGVLAGLDPDITFLHLIEETARFCGEAAPGATRIGVLATTGTYATGLYQDALSQAGLTAIIPDPAIQRDVVQKALYDREFGIKSQSNPVTEDAIELLAHATEHLIEGGAQAVILGCTEIPLAIQTRTFAGLPVVDSTIALARALIRESDPARLKPWT